MASATEVLLYILLLGGYLLLTVQQGIAVSNGEKADGSEFHTKYTTSFVFGSLIVVAVTAYLLYGVQNEDVFRYLTLVGAIGGIALSMMMLHFTKLRLNYATMD
jgi:hypothetical protein